jgi:phosphonoacetaldehyde hydrolase
MKKIECVIMDWAGTAVDYGCFAPVAAFLKAFAEKGLTVTMEEARGPMGMTKIDHIRELFKLPSVTEQFKQNYNRNWTEEDVVSIYKEFEKHLFASLEEYTTPIPGVIEVIEKLKRDGIKIGSTTGYTTAMMDIVLPGAAAHGYTTDNCVTSNNLPAQSIITHSIFFIFLFVVYLVILLFLCYGLQMFSAVSFKLVNAIGETENAWETLQNIME